MAGFTKMVLAVVLALAVGFGAGVYVQYRVTKQCATAASNYQDQFFKLFANRIGTDTPVSVGSVDDAWAAYMRCKAGGL